MRYFLIVILAIVSFFAGFYFAKSSKFSAMNKCFVETNTCIDSNLVAIKKDYKNIVTVATFWSNGNISMHSAHKDSLRENQKIIEINKRTGILPSNYKTRETGSENIYIAPAHLNKLDKNQ
jgi:hypothetical protein